MFQRILVPLDGSERAEQVLPTAARIARISGGSLLLVRVADIFADPNWQFPNSLIGLKEVIQRERASMTAYLEGIAASQILEGLGVIMHIVEGRTEQALLSVAQTMHADLIVMNGHGYTGLKRWVLGSVTQHIERHSSVPVLILRDHKSSSEQLLHAEMQPARVIVPLDGAALSEAILPAAANLSMALSSPTRGLLHLMMVLPKTHQATKTVLRGQTMTIQDAQEYLASVQQRLCQDKQVEPCLEVTSSVLQQSSVRTALTEIVAMGADRNGKHSTSYNVIAMTTHGREGLDRWLHPSVTEQVLDTSSFPILVLHPERIEASVPQDTDRHIPLQHANKPED